MDSCSVTLFYDASVNIQVRDCVSPEEALLRAQQEERAQPHLCHRCAQELELGDAIGAVVEKDGHKLFSDLPADTIRKRWQDAVSQVAVLREEVARLTQEPSPFSDPKSRDREVAIETLRALRSHLEEWLAPPYEVLASIDAEMLALRRQKSEPSAPLSPLDSADD